MYNEEHYTADKYIWTGRKLILVEKTIVFPPGIFNP
jgi:hypothetical protein